MKKNHLILIGIAVVAIVIFGWVKSTYNGMVGGRGHHGPC